MQDIDEFEAFLLGLGENIVDMIGGEIDRIEMELKVDTWILYIIYV
jgi:zinc transporter 9